MSVRTLWCDPTFNVRNLDFTNLPYFISNNWNVFYRHVSFAWMHEISLTRTGTKAKFSESQDSTENTTKSISTRLFFFVCLFVFKNLSKLQQSQVLLVVAGHTDGAILSSVECYDFETDGVLWRKYPLEKPGIPLLSLSFLIAHFPFIFVFQILALKYLLLMDVCMQFVDQMESVAWKQPM